MKVILLLFRALVLFIDDSFKVSGEIMAEVRRYLEALRVLNVKLYFITESSVAESKLKAFGVFKSSLNTFSVSSLAKMSVNQKVIADGIRKDLRGEDFDLFCE